MLKFFIRISSSFALGLFVYLFTLCNPKGSERSFLLLFSNPDKFFKTFDSYSIHFEIAFSIMFGLLAGLSLFILWRD